MQAKLKGSMTVFLSLILVSVMTLLFTMSECIRLYALHDNASEFTDMALESAFSEYNPYLWANYKILAIDLGYGSDVTGPTIFQQKLIDYCRFNADIEYGNNFARLNPAGATINQYSLLTDGGGQAMVMQGVKGAKDDLAAQVIDGIQGHMDSINGVEKVSVETKVNDGKSALEDAKRQQSEKIANAEEGEDYPEPEEVEDDPLDAFKLMKEAMSKGVLSTVMDAKKISDVSFDLAAMPSHRPLMEGTAAIQSGNAITDKALFMDYILANYSRFDLDKHHEGMQYEVEYLIAGQESDAENLAVVVGEIMLIREAANFSTIMNSGVLRTQAKSVAAVLTSFDPALEPVVELAVIGAWAYIESVLDVRLMLSGGEVAVVKSADQWTSDVWHLSSFFNVNAKARPCKDGITYDKYLIGLLAVKGNKTLGLRACDVMENALNSTEDYRYVKVDNMLFSADVTMDYTGQEMFLSLFSKDDSMGYRISKSKYLTY